MPATVVASEGVKLIDHDGLNVLEELSMIDLGGDQHRFERFWRGEQALGRISEDSFPFALSRVAVPAGGTSSDQREVVSVADALGC